MESPKEKAKELVKTFGFELAIKVADEIINLDYFSVEGRDYWQAIKNEIELLNKL